MNRGTYSMSPKFCFSLDRIVVELLDILYQQWDRQEIVCRIYSVLCLYESISSCPFESFQVDILNICCKVKYNCLMYKLYIFGQTVQIQI